jgi:hypothetical protein
MSSLEALHRFTTTGAHGQPDALVVVILPDGEVLFHDRPRMIYGMCCDARYEPVLVDSIGEAELLVRRCYIDPDYKPMGGLADDSMRYKHDRRAGEL